MLISICVISGIDEKLGTNQTLHDFLHISIISGCHFCSVADTEQYTRDSAKANMTCLYKKDCCATSLSLSFLTCDRNTNEKLTKT